MRKLFVFLCAASLIAAAASPLVAGGIENKHNWSAEWVRTLNRNAATDSADAVAYNPAGVMKMDSGFYLNVTGQYALKDYSNTYQGTKYETDEPDFVPSLFALYKQDKWAAYGAVTIVVAGGQVKYENGDATTKILADTIMASNINPAPPPIIPLGGTLVSHYLEGESYFVGYTIGGAYAINDMFSVSLGARFVDASREFKGNALIVGTNAGFDLTPTVDYEETGDGWGAIIGVNIAPTEELNIGLRYESKTSIDLETKEKIDTVPGGGLITDGAKRNRDLPALLGLGVSYKFTPKIRAEANLTYYFNDDADWDDNPVTGADETQKDDGFDIGIAFEYIFNPKWKASVGYMYTDVGIDPENMSIETPELDASTIAGGVAFSPTPDWAINLGILKTFYDDATTSRAPIIKYEKDVVIIGLGIQYKFF